MTTAHKVTFDAIPIPLLNTPGDHRLQAVTFFNKRLYLAATSFADPEGMAGTARILRYYPGAARWEAVYETTVEAPQLPANRQHRKFPLELGWRAMTVAPVGAGQDALCLSLLRARNPCLLYSKDGNLFEMLTDFGGVPTRTAPFGLLFPFRDMLFAAPSSAMSDGIAEKLAGGALLYVSRDVLGGSWNPANVQGFGDPHNQAIHCLHVFDDWLYAAVGNPFAGFQLWRTRAMGDPPFDWERVLEQGAQRHTLNSAVATMAVFRDALYLGTGVPEAERLSDEAAGCEMIRVFPNGRWELVMGQPRFSPIGLQVPISAHGPGFNETGHTLLATLASTGNTLYAAVVRRDLNGASGFQLWTSDDGEVWEPLATTNLAVPGARGIRGLHAAPKTLLVAGTWQFCQVDSARQPCLWFGHGSK